MTISHNLPNSLLPEEHISEVKIAMLRNSLRLLLLVVIALTLTRGPDLSVVVFHSQDAPILAITIVLLLALSLWPDLLRRVPVVQIPPFTPALLIVLAFIAAASGTWLVFGNFDLTRDEFMANFDADVFSSGRRAWPIAKEWRAYSDALMPLFMRGIPPEAGWISDYLPGNALLRAIAGRTVGREFANPILSAVAALALFRIVRMLWPKSGKEAAVPILLLTLSPQFLVMAMTPFAMTAHLAFNLLWLLCFLHNSRKGDAGALACGFVATGLHQLIFHSLFAAPFVVELLIAQRFRRAAIFISSYAAICLFWVMYPHIFLPLRETTNHEAIGSGIAELVGKAQQLVGSFGVANSLLMLLNLARFAAWQHPFLLVLVACAWPAIARAEGIARPLFAGIILVLIAAWALMPWQGHGWGYRYLHGFLGSFCLLANYGWNSLARSREERRAALTITTAVTVGFILPYEMVSTREMVAPYRAASALIEHSNADVVLVDGTGMLFGSDVVRNYAKSAQRPKVMDLELLKPADLRDLCNHHDVRLFDRRHGSQAGIPMTETRDLSGGRAILSAIGCDKPLSLSQAVGGTGRP